MTDSAKGWAVSVSGDSGNPDADKVAVTRHDAPRIYLEIDVQGIRSAGKDQVQLARDAIQAAVSDLQKALDSPSALPGLRQT
jgi:hypothetical protein